MNFYSSLSYSQWVKLSFEYSHHSSIILHQTCYSLMCLLSTTNSTEKMLHNEKFERCLDFFHYHHKTSPIISSPPILSTEDNSDEDEASSEEEEEDQQIDIEAAPSFQTEQQNQHTIQQIEHFCTKYFASHPLIQSCVKQIIDSISIQKAKLNLLSILEAFEDYNFQFDDESLDLHLEMPFPITCTLSIFINYARYVLVNLFDNITMQISSIAPIVEQVNKLHEIVIDMLKQELQTLRTSNPQHCSYAEYVYHGLIGLCYNEIGFNLISFMNDKQGAFSCFHQSVFYDPTNPLYISNRGRTLIAMDQLSKGMTDMLVCLQMDPTFFAVHKSLGFIYMNPLVCSKRDALIHFQLFLDWQTKVQTKQEHLSTLSFKTKSQLPLLERYYEYIKPDTHVPEVLHAIALLYRSHDEVYLSLRTLLKAREQSMMVFLREGLYHWEKEQDIDSAREVFSYFC